MIYISGPMTGLPNSNYPQFEAAAKRLRASGFKVVNPAELNPDATKPWAECMRTDIKALCECDEIYMLRGWSQSKGAQLELHIAERLGMIVFYEDD